MMTFSTLPRRAFIGTLAAASIFKLAEAADTKTLRIGIMAGEDEDVWRAVAIHAARVGLDLKIISFSDYNAPNEALSEHELDANAFQHRAFLDAQNTARGYHIVPVANTYFSPIGLYSSRWKTLSEIPKGAVIGVPNDPSNEGRALHLLASLGLCTLDPAAGALPTALDIMDNPKNLTIKELDAGIVGRTLTDLDAAVVNTDWALKAGIQIERQRIAQEPLAGNPYVNFIAVNAADEHAPWVTPLITAFQQPDVRKLILDLYHGTLIPAWT